MAILTKYPTANTPTTGFNGSGINPTDVYTDNSVYGTLVPSKPRNDEDAHCWSGFDFSAIPDGSVINSVTVKVQEYMSAANSVGQWRVTLWADATSGSALTDVTPTNSIGGSNYTRATTDTSEFEWDLGALGLEPTLAQLKAAGFGVRIEVAHGNTATTYTYYIDTIEITVDYTAPSEDKSGSGTIPHTHSVIAVAQKDVAGTATTPQTHSVIGIGRKDATELAAIVHTHTVVATGVKLQGEHYSGTGAIVETHTAVALGAKGGAGAGTITTTSHSVTATGFPLEHISGIAAIAQTHAVTATGAAVEFHSGVATTIATHTATAAGDAAEFHAGVGTITHTHSATATGIKGAAFGASVVQGHTVTATGVPTLNSLDLEGFRWRRDNGTESTATWFSPQDTLTVRPLETIVRLRTLIDTAGNLATGTVTLQYKRTDEPASEWRAV